MSSDLDVEFYQVSVLPGIAQTHTRQNEFGVEQGDF